MKKTKNKKQIKWVKKRIATDCIKTDMGITRYNQYFLNEKAKFRYPAHAQTFLSNGRQPEVEFFICQLLLAPPQRLLLFWYLLSCHYRSVSIRLGWKENVKLLVVVRGSRTSVLKDVRANCFCASLLRIQFTAPCHATSCIERARCWRNVEIYSASGHFNIYARI